MSNKRNLPELIKERLVIGDGAMGTMLYEAGVFVNVCFEELNLARQELVQNVHDEYIQAGADFIETNTFGANGIKLAKYGLADKVEQINRAAVEIAKKAVGDTEILIAGSIGPLGQELPPYGRLSVQKAQRAFTTQISALIDAGVDFLIFETFSSIDELIIGLETANKISPETPIIAQFSANEHGETSYGTKIEEAAHRIEQAAPYITAIGMNCSIGPADMLKNLEILIKVTAKPISVMPNAGLPREVDGRKLYMCTPEYMAEYAKRFLEKGARIIGGCCGTTPKHIAEIVKAVKAIDKAVHKTHIIIEKTPETVIKEKRKEPIPLEQRSRVGRKIATGELLTSVEITPPKGFELGGIIDKVRLCADCGIDAINIPDGPRASSRLSPMVTAIKIQESADIESILHVCCRDRNLIGLQSDLLGAYAMGIKNLLIITGDPPKLGDYPDATAVFDVDSIGLTALAKDLNMGVDLAGNELPNQLGFTIAVGANPVAYDIEREIARFKQKVEAGAEYAVTQPVFDPKMLKDFIDAVSSHKIPIVAGIWPFTSYKNAEFMANEVPGVVVPDKLLRKMSKAKTREQGRIIGIEIAREIIAEIQLYVQGFAISAPFGNVKIALAALEKIDIEDI